MQKSIKKIYGSILLGVASSLMMTVSIAEPMLHNLAIDLHDFYLKHKHKNSVGLLFLQESQAGSMVPDQSNQQCFTLKLTDLASTVVYFSDQPKRIAGHLSNQDFETLVYHNKKNYNIVANVAIVAFQKLPHHQINEYSEVAMLTKSNYDALSNSVTYQMCPLNGKVIHPVDHLRHVIIFIDQFHPWP